MPRKSLAPEPAHLKTTGGHPNILSKAETLPKAPYKHFAITMSLEGEDWRWLCEQIPKLVEQVDHALREEGYPERPLKPGHYDALDTDVQPGDIAWKVYASWK